MAVATDLARVARAVPPALSVRRRGHARGLATVAGGAYALGKLARRPRRHELTPLGSLTRGVAAGLAGTAVMGALQAAAHRVQGKEGGEPESWEEAPTPAKIGRRVWEGVFLRRAPEDRISLFANVVHWSYGVSLACGFALVEASLDRPRPLRDGAAFGAGAWLLGSAVLMPAARLAKPPWKYPATTNALDLGYHVVYGLTTARVFALLRRL